VARGASRIWRVPVRPAGLACRAGSPDPRARRPADPCPPRRPSRSSRRLRLPPLLRRRFLRHLPLLRRLFLGHLPGRRPGTDNLPGAPGRASRFGGRPRGRPCWLASRLGRAVGLAGPASPGSWAARAGSVAGRGGPAGSPVGWAGLSGWAGRGGAAGSPVGWAGLSGWAGPVSPGSGLRELLRWPAAAALLARRSAGPGQRRPVVPQSGPGLVLPQGGQFPRRRVPARRAQETVCRFAACRPVPSSPVPSPHASRSAAAKSRHRGVPVVR